MTKKPISEHGAALGLGTLGLTLALLGAGCERRDVGEPCDDGTPTSVGLEPVDGEEPAVEVVSVSRDGTCESFQCLRHMGLPPYCTDRCAFSEPTEVKDCTIDDDCSGDERCVEGGLALMAADPSAVSEEDAARKVCLLDDCPSGFRCDTVQEIGPLAGQTFCVRHTGCEDLLDCGAVGSIDCVEHACYDSCLALEDPTECTFHMLVCEPMQRFSEKVLCACPSSGDDLSCADVDLSCQIDGPFPQWPTGSVRRDSICVQAEPAP